MAERNVGIALQPIWLRLAISFASMLERGAGGVGSAPDGPCAGESRSWERLGVGAAGSVAAAAVELSVSSSSESEGSLAAAGADSDGRGLPCGVGRYHVRVVE